MTEENKILSEREDQILQLVAKGMTNREIAQSLTISPNTVKVHLSNIFEKLGVSSRTEATLYGIEHGIVSVSGNGKEETQEADHGQPFYQKYLWIVIPVAVLLLAAVLFVAFGRDLIFPQPTPTPSDAQVIAEMENRWQELAPMPAARTGLAAAAYDGNIYAIAGEGPEGVSGSVYRYLTSEDRWESLAEKLTPVRDVEAALLSEKIYVPGGMLANGEPTDILEIYDPRANQWESGAPLPMKLSAYAMADFEGQLYLFGGWDGEKAVDKVLIYDPGMDVWREGTPMATARYQAQAGEVGGGIYVAGGRDEQGSLHSSEIYYPVRDLSEENPWQNEILNETQNPFCVEGLGGILISFSELPGSVIQVSYYNPQQNTWTRGDEIETSISLNSVASTNLQGYVYLLGGTDENSAIPTRLFRYQGLYIVTFPNMSQ